MSTRSPSASASMDYTRELLSMAKDTWRAVAASTVFRVAAMCGRPPTMKHGELGNRVERFATRIVNEHPSFHNCGYHTLIDEVGDEMPGGCISKVRRLASGVVVSCKLFGLGSLVIGARIVERSRTSHE